MAVRKICKPKGCRGSPRCEHPWWFDVMYDGKRWRMRVDEFALVRGATEPVTSKQTAERVWEPKFLAEIVAGRDPTREARHSAEARGGFKRCRLPRSLLHQLRRGGRLTRSGHDQGTTQSGKGRPRQRTGHRAREGRAHPAVQGVVSPRACDRDGEPGAQCAPRRNQLGTVPGSTAPHELAVPPLRRHDPNEG